MSNYTKTVNFASKDALTTGDANKIVKGTEIDTEFNNIATAIATKTDTGSVITTSGGQTIAGSLTVTGAVTLGNSAVVQTLNFNNQSNFISAGGGAGFGQTSPNALYAVFVKPNATSGVGGLVTQNLTTNIGHLAFTDATGTAVISINYGTLASASVVGSITTNGTATAYNTSSDYRLKENIAPLANAVTRVKQLAPKNFTWKSHPSLGTVEGFIAHELQAVVPEAVFGEKDGVDKDGKPSYQGVDTSVLVALLTAALQEAITRIEALEAV
jgi:hypothetical protein